MKTSGWQRELPTLIGRTVTLREPAQHDAASLVEILALRDATRFGMSEPPTDPAVAALIARLHVCREKGIAFTYAIVMNATRAVAGLAQVRRLDPGFETAEAEMTLALWARGTPVFLEAARLLGTFAFVTAGVNRIEARAFLHDGRANGALRKLGAVQEGILRRSARRGDEYFDQMLWSLLCDDWGEAWASAAPRIH